MARTQCKATVERGRQAGSSVQTVLPEAWLA